MFGTRNPELKIALTQAVDEARELGHPEIGPDHLVLAMLTNVRGAAFGPLSERGLDYTTARARLIAFHAEHPATIPSAEPEADASAGLEADREALQRIGIDLDAVRDAVLTRFGSDITQDWGRRRRGRSGGRPSDAPPLRGGGHRGRAAHGHPGPRGRGPRPEFDDSAGEFDPRGRGRRGPRSRRGSRPQLTESLMGAFDGMRESLRATGRRGPIDRDQFASTLPLHLLAALLRTEDPALDAVLGEVDRDDLLVEVEARQGLLQS